ARKPCWGCSTLVVSCVVLALALAAPASAAPFVQQGPKLAASDENGGAALGYSVALSADGNTALVGGIFDHSGAGAAWVFTRSGSTWAQQGPKLVPNDKEPNEGPANFGTSVSLSADGNTALIGGPSESFGSNVFGAAWVFTRTGSTWTQQGGKLSGDDAIPQA